MNPELTWFGALSYNKFHCAKEVHDNICPLCGQKNSSGCCGWCLKTVQPMIEGGYYVSNISWEIKEERYYIGG